MKTKIIFIVLVIVGNISCQSKDTNQNKTTQNKTNQIVKDIDGNVYHTVTIGTQVWMVENLKVTKYRDGTPIPMITDSIEWATLDSGAYCNYNNNPNFAAIYGRLYNYYVIKNPKNVCPEGWHVPSDKEWQTLVYHLGGDKIAGGKLKESGYTHWTKDGNEEASNLSGFTALPGGSREVHTYVNGSCGVYDWIGLKSYFWSSTEWGDNYIWFHELENLNPYIFRNHYSARCGFSIRCIKD